MGEGEVIKVNAFKRITCTEWCGVAEIWKKKVVFAEFLIVCPCLKTGYLIHEEENEDLAELEQVQF